jgi:plastocyanin
MNHFSIALRRGALITLILAFSAVLAGCTSGGDESEPAGTDGAAGGGTATVEDGAVEITAEQSLRFSVDTIEATAGEAFTITLVNNDSAPHNISIYTEEGGDQLALGDTAEAGQTVTTEVPALDAGEYFFVCDIHPTEMTGTLVVGG